MKGAQDLFVTSKAAWLFYSTYYRVGRVFVPLLLASGDETCLYLEQESAFF